MSESYFTRNSGKAVVVDFTNSTATITGKQCKDVNADRCKS